MDRQPTNFARLPHPSGPALVSRCPSCASGLHSSGCALSFRPASYVELFLPSSYTSVILALPQAFRPALSHRSVDRLLHLVLTAHGLHLHLHHGPASSHRLGEELEIDSLSKAQFITKDSKKLFEAQGEWELLLIDTSRVNGTFTGLLQDLLVYQITIKRRPLLYAINIIIPVFFFLLLDVASFFIEASGPDKLSFKVTLLLAISVLLLILNDTLPSTADRIPLIGVYCIVIFSLIGISILETILVNYLMAKDAEEKSAALMEKTAAVSGRDDSVRNEQILPDSVRDENEVQISSFWIRVARITDVAFFIFYIITVVVFLSVLGKIWIS
nr:neuronal acetylcholine receptor subunit alpha-5-like [Danio rerio]|eukprot:XP_009298114.1 neuronal acetylcholine receptor subunit alpha-5-like [Danio rerio]